MAGEALGAADEHMETEHEVVKAQDAPAAPMEEAEDKGEPAAPADGAAAAATNGTKDPAAAADAAADASPREDAHDRRRERHYRDTPGDEGAAAIAPGTEYDIWEQKGAGAEEEGGGDEGADRRSRDEEGRGRGRSDDRDRGRADERDRRRSEERERRDGDRRERDGDRREGSRRDGDERRARDSNEGRSRDGEARRSKDGDQKGPKDADKKEEGSKEDDERRASRKDKKERKDKRSRRSRSRSGDSRSRSRSRSRRHKSSGSRRRDSRSRSRSRGHRSSRHRGRSYSRERDYRSSRRERSPSPTHDRGYNKGGRYRSRGRDGDESEDEDSIGGYRPRKRQEPPARKGVSGVSAYHDPFYHLRQQNAAQDPQEALRRWQEQQLQARQLVLQQQAASAAAAASKSQRELYIGNLVPGAVNEHTLRQVFDSGLIAAFPQAAAPGQAPVLKVNMHSEGKYGFVEFRTPEYATAAMALSGQVILGGQAISIGRPAGYVDPAKAQLAAAQAGVALAAFKAGDTSAAASLLAPGAAAGAAAPANPLMMGLPGMALPPPPAYGASAAAPTASAPGQLPHLLNAAQQAATIMAPSPPMPALPQPLMGSQPQSALAAALAQAMPTQFLCVAGMVDAQTLADDFEYREVIIDLKDECSKSGTVVEVKVPRPPNPAQSAQLINDPSNNYGKAFVQFVDVDGAAKARQAINGRMFAGSLVQVTFISQAVYAAVPAN